MSEGLMDEKARTQIVDRGVTLFAPCAPGPTDMRAFLASLVEQFSAKRLFQAPTPKQD